MSLFGAMNTAISGLTAQSAAFTNISDNVANSQTVGFKEVNTSFMDYLTSSNAISNGSSAVVAQPEYMNNVQGPVTQSTNPLALAIAGQGFFAVSQSTNSPTAGGVTTFSQIPYYTRNGDFQLNQNGYIVNSSGQYLNGWSVNAATGAVNTNALSPIQVTQSSFNPVASTQVTLAANLPATPTAGTPVSSEVSIYDSLGTAHIVTLNWTQNATNDWTVSVTSPDDITSPAVGSAEVKFGTTSGNAVASGTVGSLSNATGSMTTTAYSASSPADLTFTTNFGQGAQVVTLNLGSFGQSNGLTQYAGTTYSLGGITQNGVPPGSFSSVTTNTAGDVSVNYSNGQSQVVAQVPVVTFSAPDSLQSQNGQSYTATNTSGNPLAQSAGNNGAGALVTGSVEQSNVDIATQFTSLIVAQQAYSANTKVVTSADQMLQETINMKT